MSPTDTLALSTNCMINTTIYNIYVHPYILHFDAGVVLFGFCYSHVFTGMYVNHVSTIYVKSILLILLLFCSLDVTSAGSIIVVVLSFKPLTILQM